MIRARSPRRSSGYSMKLGGNYPEWARPHYEILLAILEEHCVDAFELNRSDASMDEPSGDLDLVVSSGEVWIIQERLRELGYLKYRSVNSGQEMWMKLIPGGGFAQIHLYSDVRYFGRKLAGREELASIEPEALFLAELFYKNTYSERAKRKHERLTRCEKRTSGYRLHPRIAAAAERARLHLLEEGRRAPLGSVRHAFEVFRVNGIAAIGQFGTRALRRVWKLLGRGDDFVIFLMGADGTGKTTAADLVFESLAEGGPYTRRVYLGLRHSWVNGIREAAARAAKRGSYNAERADSKVSTARFPARCGGYALIMGCAYWFEWILRFAWGISFRRVVAPTVWLVDRCYLDALLHYDHPIPRTLFLRFGPRPSAVLALRGDSAKVAARKGEISAERTAELMARYDALFAELSSSGWRLDTIDTSMCEPGAVAARILAIVAKHLHDVSHR